MIRRMETFSMSDDRAVPCLERPAVLTRIAQRDRSFRSADSSDLQNITPFPQSVGPNEFPRPL
jgi:hypothetical protein